MEGKERVTVIKYADDKVVLASIEEDVQKFMNRIAVIGKTLPCNRKMNAMKTKLMGIAKKRNEVNVIIGVQKLEIKRSFSNTYGV